MQFLEYKNHSKGDFLMHTWVIYVGRHLSRTLTNKNSYYPSPDYPGLLGARRTFYHVAIKADVYCKAVHVYTIYIYITYPLWHRPNSADPYLSSPITAYTVYYSICIFWTQLCVCWCMLMYTARQCCRQASSGIVSIINPTLMRKLLDIVIGQFSFFSVFQWSPSVGQPRIFFAKTTATQRFIDES